MKKKRVGALLLAFFILSVVVSSHAAEEKPIAVYFNQKEIQLTHANPVLQNGRTLVPVRKISEALGFEVTFIPVSNVVIVKNANTRIVLKMNEPWAIVNVVGKYDAKRSLDAPPQLLEGKTYIPLRFVSEILEYRVHWEASTRSVYLEKKDIQ